MGGYENPNGFSCLPTVVGFIEYRTLPQPQPMSIRDSPQTDNPLGLREDGGQPGVRQRLVSGQTWL